ncbi:unnamed protein product [Caenorhabditis nigoni]
MSSAIPDADRKLSYDCLKCIIQKFKVNFRFQLAERLPKIRFAEKAAPLYISKLSITGGGFELNDTKYHLGVIRQAREGPNPEVIEDDNREGGTERDVDRFGFEKRTLPELTPGDIFIQDFDPPVIPLDNFAFAEAMVVQSRNALMALQMEKMAREYSPEQLERINARIRNVKRTLEHAELAVQRFQCELYNLPPPYNVSIQFTKTSPDGNVYTERSKYDKSLKETRKYLISKFLGNRQLVTKIKSLSFWASFHDGLVVGLPESIKFDVQEFGTSGKLPEVLQHVETILEYPNRPFARLESDNLRLEDAQDPKVQKAGVLALFEDRNIDVIALCREAPNKKIVITLTRYLELGNYGTIAEDLINTKSTLGTCYEITAINDEGIAREVLRVAGEHFANAVVGEKLVTIPLPSELKLEVSYGPFHFSNSRTSLYTIKMEVVQSQSIGL